MVDSDDIRYFKERANQERELSESATSELAAQAHLSMADRYDRLAAGLAPERPTLRIITG